MDGVGPVGGSHIPEMGESNVGGSSSLGSLGTVASDIANRAQNLVNSGDQTGALSYLKGALAFLRYTAFQGAPPGAQFPALYADVSNGSSNVNGAIAGLKGIASNSAINGQNLFQYLEGQTNGAGMILAKIAMLMQTKDEPFGAVNVTNPEEMEGLIGTAKMVMQGVDANASPSTTNAFVCNLSNTILNSLSIPGTASTVNFMRTFVQCVPQDISITTSTSSIIKGIWTHLTFGIQQGTSQNFGNSTTLFNDYISKLETFLSTDISDAVVESGDSGSLASENMAMYQSVQSGLQTLLSDGVANNGTPKNLEADLQALDDLISKNLPTCFPD